MLSSGFGQTQGAADARFINYLMEHDHRWLMQSSGHESLMDPAMFWPQKNAEAFSDTFISFLPFYSLWRWMGLDWDSAYQACLLTLSVANFLGGFVLLRWGFKRGVFGASAGAFLLSFAVSRQWHINHLQLWVHVYITMAIVALIGLFRCPQTSQFRIKRLLWIVLFYMCLTAQFYGAFYLIFFFALCLAITVVVALMIPSLRRGVLLVLRWNWLALLFGAVCVAVACWPLARSYMEARKLGGPWSWQLVSNLLARPQSWIYVNKESWWYGWMDSMPFFSQLPTAQEQPVGFGFLSTIVVLGTVFWQRRLAWVKLLAIVSAVVIVLGTCITPQWSPWKLIYDFVPGGNGLRAVCRIALMLLYPGAILLAMFADKLWSLSPKWKVLGVAVVIACCLEQGSSSQVFDKQSKRQDVRAIAARVKPGFKAFYWTSHDEARNDELNVDAMLASLESGVPTVNGYTGRFPPKWTALFDLHIRLPEADEPALLRALERWCYIKQVRVEDIQWLPQPPRYRYMQIPLGEQMAVCQECWNGLFAEGWGKAGTIRWTRGNHCRMVFSLKGPFTTEEQYVLKIVCMANLAKTRAQVVLVSLNGRQIGAREIRQNGRKTLDFNLRADLLREVNTLVLDLPNALAESEYQVERDPGQAGLGIKMMELSRQSAGDSQPASSE